VQQKRILLILSLSLLLVNLLLFGLLVTRHSPIAVPAGRAQSDGVAGFCINHRPVLVIPCNATVSQNSPYFCQLNVSDPDGGNFTFWQIPANKTILNVTPAGVINFTPNQSHVGNHSTVFAVRDGSGCINSVGVASFNFSVENVNDPPYLAKEIPEQEFPVNTTLAAFFLTDYFVDPDGDPMNFTSTIPSTFTVTIMESSLVVFSSTACLPGGEMVTFTATDPYNASGESNQVRVKVKCPKSQSQGNSDSSTGGGGGGGGGSVNICKENWECDEWGPCLPTNFSWRRCYDTRGCKPEEYQKRLCTYGGPAPVCQENWLCQEWGKCFMNGTQYRGCADLQECGTEAVKPPTAQKCNYLATCDDGIQNGNETGVDCGGECPACAIVQQPKPILGNGGLSRGILIAIILSILLIAGILRYYRAQIAQGIATLGFLLKHRAYKEVLLDAAQRKSLFEQLHAFEAKLPEMRENEPERAYTALSSLIRTYYVEALGVNHEAIPEEIAAKCKELGLHEETTMLLTGLFAKLPILEQETLDYDELFIIATAEELRTAVCMTSDYTREEIVRQIDEIPITDKMSFYDEIFARATNVMRAVQFDQLELAHKEYMTILTRYDPLSEAEKEQIYPELKWIFDTVKLKSEITGAKIVRKPQAAIA
jgi:hypothetical protein